MARIIVKLVLVAALIVFSTGMASAETIRVGIAAEPYPPFTTPDASGNWSGWEIDIMKAICEEAKLDCVITPTAWDGIIPALTGGRFDIIGSAMSITEERLQQINFTEPYLPGILAISAPIDAPIAEAADLAQAAEHGARGDGVQPGRQRRLASERGQAAERLEEGLLGEVLGQGLVAGHAVGQPEHPVDVGVVDGPLGGGVGQRDVGPREESMLIAHIRDPSSVC